MLTHAFTCTGPYAILILLGIKRVENRSMMPVSAAVRCAVSCSKKFCREEYGEFVRWASRALAAEDFETIPAWNDVKDWPGKVVGTCDYVARPRGTRGPADGGDVAAVSGKPPYRGMVREAWDEGYGFWWDLSEVVCLDEPIPCRGNVGMWQMPPALAAQVTAADSRSRMAGEKVACTEDAVRMFKAALPLVGDNEGVFVLPLDDQRRVLAPPTLVSLGDHQTAAVHVGEVFASALKLNAKAVIVAHNHPSGNAAASVQDRLLTAELKRLGALLGVEVLDHLILAGEKWHSCARK